MGRKLAMDPGQIENRSNLAHQVIVRHRLIKIKRIEQLTLISDCSRPIIARLPKQFMPMATESLFESSNRLLQQNRPIAEATPRHAGRPARRRPVIM